MTKELESKMCNFLSYWVVVRTGLLKFEKFLFSWIPLFNTIILRGNMFMLWSKLKKLWVIQYFWSFTACPSSHPSSVHLNLHPFNLPLNPYPAECNYCDFGKLSSLCWKYRTHYFVRYPNWRCVTLNASQFNTSIPCQHSLFVHSKIKYFVVPKVTSVSNFFSLITYWTCQL